MRPPIDEAFALPGLPRSNYATILGELRERDLAVLQADMAAAVDAIGMTHGAGDAEHPFPFDPVPRLVDAGEWEALGAGLRQRVRALEAFVADAHGAQESLRSGVVPAATVESCPWFERDLLGSEAAPVSIGIAGPDLARDADGRMLVLEDNVRTPTMLAYAVAGREIVRSHLEQAPPGQDVAGQVRRGVRRLLRASAPWTDEPVGVILGDGRINALRWEIGALGRLLDLPVVGLGDLRVRDGRLLLRATGQVIDVVWRRTCEERLRDDAGRLNALGEALIEPLRAGRLAVVNGFGTGVADDKGVFPHVEDLVRFFLSEEPLLDSARAYDLTRAGDLCAVLERLPELVCKPRDGSGGRGVMIGPTATEAELAAMRRRLREDPRSWIAQETIALSTHPTLVDGRLEPRHVDLRPYVLASPDGFEVLPVAFTRFSPAAGDMVVNCSRGGGGKDVWIVPGAGSAPPDASSTQTSLTPPPRDVLTTSPPAVMG